MIAAQFCNRQYFNLCNYSEPHAQNRIFDALLLLMWLLRHINRVKYACKQAYFASICMALNSYQSIMIAHVPYEPTLLS